MTSLFPGCGPSCARKKKLDALQYAKDSEAYEVALYGDGWVRTKKQEEATKEADEQVSKYKKQFAEWSHVNQPADSDDVKDMKYQINRDVTLAAILNRLHTLFNKPSPSSYSGWWFGLFLDFVITVLAAVVIYMIYSVFIAGRMVGGKRLGK
jgi:hypothetical protein